MENKNSRIHEIAKEFSMNQFTEKQVGLLKAAVDQKIGTDMAEIGGYLEALLTPIIPKIQRIQFIIEYNERNYSIYIRQYAGKIIISQKGETIMIMDENGVKMPGSRGDQIIFIHNWKQIKEGIHTQIEYQLEMMKSDSEKEFDKYLLEYNLIENFEL